MRFKIKPCKNEGIICRNSADHGKKLYTYICVNTDIAFPLNYLMQLFGLVTQCVLYIRRSGLMSVVSRHNRQKSRHIFYTHLYIYK